MTDQTSRHHNLNETHIVMTENPPAPAAAIAVTTTKTRKHVTEGYDFWYNVCRIYEENDDNDVAKAKLLHR